MDEAHNRPPGARLLTAARATMHAITQVHYLR